MKLNLAKALEGSFEIAILAVVVYLGQARGLILPGFLFFSGGIAILAVAKFSKVFSHNIDRGKHKAASQSCLSAAYQVIRLGNAIRQCD